MSTEGKTKKRVYRVRDRDGNVRMVWAFNRSQAINHVSEGDYSANVASQAEIIQMVRQGVPEEVAGENRVKDEPLSEASVAKIREGGAA
ncbi:MAG: hypothetical protein FKY71_12735 [Spiribacter salinus]|uniref:Uncharacterized protein n=1 Tax=Spiribacter salinus TaxID=1335746 RepID=A0A540VPJ9_9GAMM|nr:MAG: hypothetical protein FKY71_12735 [Spiribacter salinus]